MNRSSIVLVLVGMCFLACGAAQAEKAYIDSDIELRHKVLVRGSLCHLYDGGSVLIVTDKQGRIVRNITTARRAAFTGAIFQQWCNPAEIDEYAQHRKNIDKFIKLEAGAQIALFIRNSASKALVDVSVALLELWVEGAVILEGDPE